MPITRKSTPARSKAQSRVPPAVETSNEPEDPNESDSIFIIDKTGSTKNSDRNDQDVGTASRKRKEPTETPRRSARHTEDNDLKPRAIRFKSPPQIKRNRKAKAPSQNEESEEGFISLATTASKKNTTPLKDIAEGSDTEDRKENSPQSDQQMEENQETVLEENQDARQDEDAIKSDNQAEEKEDVRLSKDQQEEPERPAKRKKTTKQEKVKATRKNLQQGNQKKLTSRALARKKADELKKEVFGAEEFEEATEEPKEEEAQEQAAAWEDPEDETISVVIDRKLKKEESEEAINGVELSKRLKDAFQKAQYQSVDWAKVPNKAETEDEILRTAAKLALRKTALFQPGTLAIKCLGDPLAVLPLRRLVSLQFHPELPLVLGVSEDMIRYYRNTKQFTDDIPEQTRVPMGKTITDAKFNADGTQIFVVFKQANVWCLDIKTKKKESFGIHRSLLGLRDEDPLIFQGWKNIVVSSKHYALIRDHHRVAIGSVQTKQVVGFLELVGNATAAVFSPDGTEIYTSTDKGEVFVWNVASRRCTKRFNDQGSNGVTAMAISHNGEYLAVGAVTGVVNVYDTSKLVKGNANPEPLKTLMQLTTAIDHIAFHHSNLLMAISSSEMPNAFRFFHIPTFSAFVNWTSALPRGTNSVTVKHIAFDNNESVILGFSDGKTAISRLLHFSSRSKK